MENVMESAEVWSMEKQRRSSIDWHSLVPKDVARAQIAYERRETVYAMRQAGFTLATIGKLFGLSTERVRHFAVHAEWSRNPPNNHPHVMRKVGIPVSRYFNCPVVRRSSQGVVLAEE
jgi:hypothetical protein